MSIDQSFSRCERGWSPPAVAFDRRGRWQAGVWENLPAKLQAAARRLSGVALERGDALELIGRYDQRGAVIYCDPPYPLATRLAPERCYAVDDDGTLWPRLIEVLAGIQHAAVILSGYDCPAADGLGWAKVRLVHRRTVQARAGGSLPYAPEVAWLSPAARAGVPTLLDGLPAAAGDVR